MEIEKPSLTLTPDLSVPAQEPAPAPQPAAELGEEASLTDEEKAMVESFASQIDIKNPSMVLQYGAGTQQKMA